MRSSTCFITASWASSDVPGGIVVAQDATWNSDASNTPLTVYSAFGLRDGSISSIHRFASLEEARAFPLAA